VRVRWGSVRAVVRVFGVMWLAGSVVCGMVGPRARAVSIFERGGGWTGDGRTSVHRVCDVGNAQVLRGGGRSDWARQAGISSVHKS